MTTSAEAALNALLREVMPRNLLKLTLEDKMTLHGELGIDSMGLMCLAFRLEEEFRVDLTLHAEKVANLQTLGDVRELLKQLEGQERR
jgi:acyl carrier protein